MAEYRFQLGVQWHLTDMCDQKCQHCYVWTNPSGQREKFIGENGCYQIINQLVRFEQDFGVEIGLVITGGDPLLYPHFWKVLEETNKRGWKITILGNPFHLTKDVSQKLFALGCITYQMSIDGIRKTHDFIRKEGSFDATLENITLLKDADILSTIMATVSELNIDEMVEVAKICVESGADRFTFARYGGNGKNNISPDRYRNFLSEMYDSYQSLQGSGCSFPFKDHLWKPFFQETGIASVDTKVNCIVDGCHCGFGHISILPNGDVYACRRFESLVGNLFVEDLSSIFVSTKMDKYRQIEEMECSKCELKFYCRGCPAVSYGNYDGDWKRKDPQCWRKL